MEPCIVSNQFQPNEPVCDDKSYLFDSVCFSLLPRLCYWMDGPRGKRTMFIEDENKTITISIEEEGRCLDLSSNTHEHCFEYQQGSRYLHQVRHTAAAHRALGSFAFFHMAITDQTGNVYRLPGQMLVNSEYKWAEDVEPLLVNLLNSITIPNRKALLSSL